MTLDETHDPALRSWVASANVDGTDFPIQNLPFGRFRRAGGGHWRIGVAIGDQVLDLRAALEQGGWPADIHQLLDEMAWGAMKPLIGASKPLRQSFRSALSQALREGSHRQAALASCLVQQDQAEMTLPCRIGDYTDFYTGIYHATAVGKLFRPDSPLLPNYGWVPIGYHGRSSSIVPSGHAVRRPLGQTKHPVSQVPDFGPTRRLDYEAELGFLVGRGNPLGEPISVDRAEDHLFGVVLLNDWSARDIQPWEYQPLGPFLSKNFASTISPWVVTLEALAPFRSPLQRPPGHPHPLPYLDSKATRSRGAFDIQLSACLQTAAMRDAGAPAVRLAASSAAEAAFWTAAQLLAHHTCGGCNLQTGDLLGSGTLSGPLPGQAGSLLELTTSGQVPLQLPNGEERKFLEDGDTLTLRGHCEREGARRIGFGECSGTVLARAPQRSLVAEQLH